MSLNELIKKELDNILEMERIEEYIESNNYIVVKERKIKNVTITTYNIYPGEYTYIPSLVLIRNTTKKALIALNESIIEKDVFDIGYVMSSTFEIDKDILSAIDLISDTNRITLQGMAFYIRSEENLSKNIISKNRFNTKERKIIKNPLATYLLGYVDSMHSFKRLAIYTPNRVANLIANQILKEGNQKSMYVKMTNHAVKSIIKTLSQTDKRPFDDRPFELLLTYRKNKIVQILKTKRNFVIQKFIISYLINKTILDKKTLKEAITFFESHFKRYFERELSTFINEYRHEAMNTGKDQDKFEKITDIPDLLTSSFMTEHFNDLLGDRASKKLIKELEEKEVKEQEEVSKLIEEKRRQRREIERNNRANNANVFGEIAPEIDEDLLTDEVPF